MARLRLVSLCVALAACTVVRAATSNQESRNRSSRTNDGRSSHHANRPHVAPNDGRANESSNKYYHDDNNNNNLQETSRSQFGIIDFRDLLLPPDQARSLGGSGDAPYGDAFSSMLFPAILDEFLSVEPFNSRIIVPLTADQSGQAGTVVLPDVADFELPKTNDDLEWLTDDVRLKVSNLEISNLDTVTQLTPLQAKGPDRLFNRIVMGSSASPPTVTFDISVFVGSSESSSPIFMNNTLQVIITVPTIAIEFDLITSIREWDVMNIPLRDASNVYCWISSIERSQLTGLDLQNLVVTMPAGWSIDLKCPSCTSTISGTALEQMFGITLKALGFPTTFAPRIETLIEESILGYWKSVNSDEFFERAPKLCPHREEYEGDAVLPTSSSSAFDVLTESLAQVPFPDASRYTVETLLGGILIWFQVAMIAVLRGQAEQMVMGNIDESNRNLLALAEDSQTLSAVNDYVDWTDLEDSVGRWSSLGLRELQKYLKSPSTVMELLQEIEVLDEDGVLDVTVQQDTIDTGIGFNMTLANLRVHGLESIEFRSILDPVGPTTLSTIAHLDKLGLDLVFGVEMNSDGAMNGTASQETKLEYIFRDVEIGFNTSIVLERDRLWDMQISSIALLDSILPCTLQGLSKLEISRLSMQSNDVVGPQLVSAFLDNDFQQQLVGMSSALMDMYKADALIAQQAVVDDIVKDVLNAFIAQQIKLQQRETDCEVLDLNAATQTPMVDFRDLLLDAEVAIASGGTGSSQYGDLFRRLYSTVYDTLDGDDVNTVVAKATEKESGTPGVLEWPVTVMDRAVSITLAGLEAIMAVKISDVTVMNLDSVGSPFVISRPIDGEGQGLNTSFTFGTDGRPLMVVSEVELSISDGDSINIQNTLNMSVAVDTFNILSTILLSIDSQSLFNFYLRDSDNVFCWLATLPSKQASADNSTGYALEILEYALNVNDLGISIECTACTSPTFDDLLMSLYAPQADDEPGAVIRNVAGKVAGSDLLSEFVDAVVRDSGTVCPHRPEYDEAMNGDVTVAQFLETSATSLATVQEVLERSPDARYFTLANAGVAVVLFVMALALRCWTAWKGRALVDSLSMQETEWLNTQQALEQQRFNYLDRSSASLVRSKHLPRSVRYGVPLYLLLNFGLFLGGHFGVLSVLELDTTLAGQSVYIKDFLVFTFISATRRTYQNGGSEMAVLMWVFTGIWPYIKLILCFVAWLLPPSRLPVQRRERILLWIDSLVRLSVIDLFTGLIGIATILIYVGGKERSVSTDEAGDRQYAMRLVVVPHAGVYCLVIAQRMSRVSSQFLLDCHERVLAMSDKACTDVVCTEKDDDLDAIMSKANQVIIVDDSPLATSRDSGSDGGNHNEERRRARKNKGANSKRRRRDDDDQGRGSLVLSGDRREFPSESTADRFDDVGSADSFHSNSSSSSSSSGSTMSDDDLLSSLSLRKRWGILGISFGTITVISIFVIGAALAPSVSIDVSDVWTATLESGKTFEEVVDEYGVFYLASTVLLKARFATNETRDYIGLGLLIGVALLSVSITFAIKLWYFLKERLGWDRRDRGYDSDSDDSDSTTSSSWSYDRSCLSAARSWCRNVCDWRRHDDSDSIDGDGARSIGDQTTPTYLHFNKYKHVEVFAIAVTIGVWQLGSVSSYAVHTYCVLLERLYTILSSVGLVADTSANCFRVQASDPGFLSVIMAAFLGLMAAFAFGVRGQVQKNIHDAKTSLQSNYEDPNNVTAMFTLDSERFSRGFDGEQPSSPPRFERKRRGEY